MNRPEELLQKSVVKLLSLAAPHDLVWFAVPNQRGTRARYEQAILHAMGVRAGVADLCFVIPPEGRFACIELKAGENTPGPVQLEFARQVERAGGKWACAWTVEEVITALGIWGVKLRLAG